MEDRTIIYFILALSLCLSSFIECHHNRQDIPSQSGDKQRLKFQLHSYSSGQLVSVLRGGTVHAHASRPSPPSGTGSRSGSEQHVFVTVGTTSFDNLVKASSTQDFCQLLVEQGYTSLTLQIGRGSHTPDTTPTPPGLVVSWYRYKPSLTPDMQQASLIISHGGSGCILESLSLGKPLVVVVNEELMGNHQTELAEQMASLGVLLCTTHKGLYETVQKLPHFSFNKYEAGKPQKLANEIDKIMGFTS